MITGSWEKRVKVWVIYDQTVECVQKLEHERLIDRVLITPNNEYIIGVGANSSVTVWESSNFTKLYTIKSNDFTSRSATLSLHGEFIAVPRIKDWSLLFDVYEVATGEKVEEGIRKRTSFDYKYRNRPLFLYKSENNAFKLRWGIVAPNNSFFLSSEYEANQNIYDHKFQETIPHLSDLPGLSRIDTDLTDVCISENGNFIARPYSNRSEFGINLWDVDSRSLLHKLQGHRDLITITQISPNNQYLASASGDKTVKIWDVASGRLLQTLRGHNDFVGTMGFSRDMKIMGSGSYEGELFLWSIREPK
jgi:WD40 repeat protein